MVWMAAKGNAMADAALLDLLHHLTWQPPAILGRPPSQWVRVRPKRPMTVFSPRTKMRRQLGTRMG